ncbi:MAG: TonB-dependent receptor domain-containing protein [Bryobacteraceae bacterium]
MSIGFSKRGGAAALLWIAVSGPAMAQDPRGAITGKVLDASGAVVPGAEVRAIHAETKVQTRTSSNQAGSYDLPYLLPGTYRLTAGQPGFKAWTQSGVEVRMGDRLRLDIRLEVGEVTEVVEVAAQAPLLESATATIGQVIGNRQIAELPLRGGSLGWVFAMAPGVVLERLPFDGPWNVTHASSVSLGGSGFRFGSADFNMDGVSNNSYGGQTAMVPPPDMVQEVRVEVASFDASVGHSAGGSVNVSLKSGTNALHGALGGSITTGPLIARDFFVNKFIFDPNTGPITPQKIKDNTPPIRWIRTSAAVGGPLVIPKLYDGHNRTFWMFGFQAHLDNRTVSNLSSVPTGPQRGGDFSALLALGTQYQIYDPRTTVPSGASRFARQPLPGNRIPASRIDPNARKTLEYFPLPNTTGTADALNNYSRPYPEIRELYQPIVRFDHVFSESHRMFARYSHSDFTGDLGRIIPESKVRGRLRKRPHRGFALDQVFVVSPRAVFDLRYGLTWFREQQSYVNNGWDLKEFGFPESLIAQMDPAGISFPAINITGLLALGNDGGFVQTIYSHSLLGVLNWTRGNHSLRFGADLRFPFETYKSYGNTAPRLDFGQTYTRGPLDNSPVAPAGQGLASFLFGIPTGGGMDLNDSRAEANRFYSGFVQDDWRLSRKLTLNLGLRWEYESPLTERFNRSARDFDFTAVNPVQSRAAAQYARSPIPELAPASFRTLGGVTFAGAGGNPRMIHERDFRAFMPRIGLAYQLLPKMILRGGYGIYFDLLGADFDDALQPGFSQRTNVVASLDNGMTYIASLSNPLPLGLEKPQGARGGLETFLGRSPGFFSSDGRRSYNQRWSGSIQFEPVRQTAVEVGYMGSRGVRQRVATEFNPIPRQYLSASAERDQPVIDFLSARAANPFIGIPGFAGSTFFATANTTRSQLLRPYPHFTGLSAGLPAGSVWYNAMTLRVERRFGRGLQIQGSYTWSKTMDALTYLNETDPVPEHVVSDLDRPHRIVVSGMYELPFGKGRKFLSSSGRLANAVLGGWQVQAIFQGQSGGPLMFANVLYRGEYRAIDGGTQSLDAWFNTAGFERRAAAQLANNIRSFPSAIPYVREDGINIWDLSVHKNFRLREGWKLQVRAESEGAMNHPIFAPPNTVPTSTLFGQVTATAQGAARKIFVGGKFLF